MVKRSRSRHLATWTLAALGMTIACGRSQVSPHDLSQPVQQACRSLSPAEAYFGTENFGLAGEDANERRTQYANELAAFEAAPLACDTDRKSAYRLFVTGPFAPEFALTVTQTGDGGNLIAASQDHTKGQRTHGTLSPSQWRDLSRTMELMNVWSRPTFPAVGQYVAFDPPTWLLEVCEADRYRIVVLDFRQEPEHARAVWGSMLARAELPVPSLLRK